MLKKSEFVKDDKYNIPLSPLQGLPDKPLTTIPFPVKSLDFNDFLLLLGTRRNASAPGINAIPYKVYKNCPQLSRFLFNIFKSCLKHCVVPIQWQYAMEHYIPKTDQTSPSKIEDFRPIALLNVERKLFFSLISKRLDKHIIANNKYINTSVQKECMEKVPGCWEHMCMVWAALKGARCNKLNVANIWLDIANGYGTIPHRLIFFALERYGVHEHWISLIKAYYSGIYSKSFSSSAPSSWHQHFKGIFAGCTLSIILFLAGINVIIEYAILSKAPPFIYSGKVSLPLVRAFMDDMSLMSSSVPGANDLLSLSTTVLTWADISYRAHESPSIVIIKGRSMNSTPFSIEKPSTPTDFSNFIPSIHSQPVKFLGHIIDGSLSDRKSVSELEKKLFSGLKIIDRSPFKGGQKLWILQHLLVSRIQWP